MPLSATVISQRGIAPSSCAWFSIRLFNFTTGGVSGRANFNPLPTRFCSSCRICNASASSEGNGPTSTRPPIRWMRSSKSDRTSSAMAARFTGANGCAFVVTREKVRSASIRLRIRVAEASIRAR